MQKVLLALFFLPFVGLLSVQSDISITGRLIEEDSKTPVSFATVALE